MRRLMLVSALENTVRNLRYANRLATFEVGGVYLPEAGDGCCRTKTAAPVWCCAARAIPKTSTPRRTAAPEMDFFDLKA